MGLLEKYDKATEFEEYAWTVAEAATSVTGALLDCELISSLGKIGAYLDTRKAIRAKFGGLEPNPHFVANGLDSGGGKRTLRYFAGRGAKSALGTGIGLATKAATAVTIVDVGGLAKEGQATGLSIAHAAKLKAMAKKYRQSQTITAWIELVTKLKMLKAGIRGTGIVGAAVPFAGAVGVITDCLQAAAKVGVKLNYGNVASRTAMELHWRAHQEQVFSGKFTGTGSGAVGPASAILYELFTKRGATRIFGKYDVDAFIAEPPGWLAVNDKITLI